MLEELNVPVGPVNIIWECMKISPYWSELIMDLNLFGYFTVIYKAPGHADCFLQIFVKEWVTLWTVIPPVQQIREISSLLNIPQSAVSCVMRKLNCLGTTATHSQSVRPYKLTDQGQQMLKSIVRRDHQLSAGGHYIDL